MCYHGRRYQYNSNPDERKYHRASFHVDKETHGSSSLVGWTYIETFLMESKEVCNCFTFLIYSFLTIVCMYVCMSLV